MKTTSKIIAIAITTFLSVDAMAQELPPANAPGAELAQTPPVPRPGREGRGPGRGAGRGAGRGELRELTAYKGTVVAYTANDRFEYDGFTFKSGSATYNVKFPAHMGQQLMKSASKGSTVTINGLADTDPEGQNMLRMVTLQAGGTTISDNRRPRSLEVREVETPSKIYSGTIQEVTRNRDGNVNGAIIGNNQMVSLPPHVSEQLSALLKTGQKVEVYGFERPKRDGVVMSRKLQSIDAQTLKIGDKTYLIR